MWISDDFFNFSAYDVGYNSNIEVIKALSSRNFNTRRKMSHENMLIDFWRNKNKLMKNLLTSCLSKELVDFPFLESKTT